MSIESYAASRSTSTSTAGGGGAPPGGTSSVMFGMLHPFPRAASPENWTIPSPSLGSSPGHSSLYQVAFGFSSSAFLNVSVLPYPSTRSLPV